MKIVEFNLRINLPDDISDDDSRRIIAKFLSSRAETEFDDLGDDSFKEAFEKVGNFGMNPRSITSLSGHVNFGQAIQAMKEGYLVSREGWNGKGMFLWIKGGTKIKSENCRDPYLKSIADLNNGEVDGLPTICMKTADNKVLTGWLASQTDMLAEDWIIIPLEGNI